MTLEELRAAVAHEQAKYRDCGPIPSNVALALIDVAKAVDVLTTSEDADVLSVYTPMEKLNAALAGQEKA